MEPCKYEAKKLEELHELSYDDLRGCNCDRCQPVADRKRLVEVEAKLAQIEIEKAADEVAEEIVAKETADREAFEAQLKSMVDARVTAQLGATKRYFPHENKKSTFAPSGEVMKRFNINTGGFRKQDVEPETKEFIHWIATGEETPEYKMMKRRKAFERKDLAGGSGGGANAVPDEMAREIVRDLNEGSLPRQIGIRTFNMGSDILKVPTETAETTAARVAEAAAITPGDPTISSVTLTAQKIVTETVASSEFVADAVVDVANYLRQVFADALARYEGEKFVQGSGTNEPKGLQSAGYTAVTGTAGDAKATLTSLVYALTPAYRRQAVIVAHSNFIKELADELSDAWLTSWRAGQPPTFLGLPIFESTDIPNDGTTNAKHDIFIFNPRFYAFGQRGGFTLARSDHANWSTDEIAFRLSERIDMQPLLANAGRFVSNYQDA
jgi:HK97 family phage major capsid protein